MLFSISYTFAWANERSVLKKVIEIALWRLPVGLENVDNANVDEQPLASWIASWNTSHAEKSRKQHTSRPHSALQTAAQTRVQAVTLTGPLNPELPSLEPPPEWTPWPCSTDFSGLVADADLESRRPLTLRCPPNCPRCAPALDSPGPYCGCPSTGYNPWSWNSARAAWNIQMQQISCCGQRTADFFQTEEHLITNKSALVWLTPAEHK